MDVYNEIVEFISKKSKVSVKELTPTTKIFKSGLISSLSTLDLMSYLEQKFSITIDPEELIEDNFEDIGTIDSFVKKKIKA